jgi:hypothetical protein
MVGIVESAAASIQLQKNFALVYDTFCERLERLKTLHAQVLTNFELVNELLQDQVEFLPASDRESIARLFDDPSSCLLVVGEVNAGVPSPPSRSCHGTPPLASFVHPHAFLAGKSTLWNLLLGCDVFPVSRRACRAR